MVMSSQQIDNIKHAQLLEALVDKNFKSCRYCNELQVAWLTDKEYADILGYKIPISINGYPHFCKVLAEQKKLEKEQKLQSHPPQQITSEQKPAYRPPPAQSTTSGQLNTDRQGQILEAIQKTEQKVLTELEYHRTRIENNNQMISEYYKTILDLKDIINDWIRDNPIERSHNDLLARMFPVFNRLQENSKDVIGFQTADKLKRIEQELKEKTLEEKSVIEDEDDDFVDSKADF